MKRWTDDEVEILKENYSKMYGKVSELVLLFDNKYTYGAITSKAEKLGLVTRHYWNKEEIDIMRSQYSNKTIDELSILIPNHNRNSIINKAVELKLTNKVILENRFTQYEKNFIRNNCQTMTDKEIGKILNKKPRSISDYRNRNNIHRIYEKSSYLDLSEYIRRNNGDWRKRSMQNCGYKCVITGERFDDIHHLYGFNLILNQALDVLHMPIKETIDEYSEKELVSLLRVFREIQDTYPLGVCLTKEIHMQFHELYGYGNNIISQWNEFIKQFEITNN